MATDIAFCVGLLAVLGSRIPTGLKVFLLALAIVDDIGAVLVIAIFYTEKIEMVWVVAAFALCAVVFAMKHGGVSRPVLYLIPGALLWYATLRSGVHATIAGVALGLITPAAPVKGRDVLDRLEHLLHPWVAYVIIPVFAVANAGVALSAEAVRAAVEGRVAWGILGGLVIGKTVGISAASLIAIRIGVARFPSGVNSRYLVGAAAMAGIGFTVSLFIASLSFANGELVASAKIGILTASALSAIIGVGVLFPGGPAGVRAGEEGSVRTAG